MVRAKALAAEASPTARMTRLEAFAEETVWVGRAGATPGEMSDWHHHGDRGTDELVMVVVRVGEGPLVFNVVGPDPAG